MPKFEIIAQGTDQNVSATYYAYIRQDVDGTYYDQSDAEFTDFTSLVDGKIPFTESAEQPGVWSFDVSLGDVTGTYTMLPRQGNTDLLVESQVEHLFLHNGQRLTDPRIGVVALHTHYGGINTLRLVSEDGNPVSGATISVYREEDYAQGSLQSIVGASNTNEFGGWTVPIFVPVGNTYTIVYHKEGVISTTPVEITVP